MKNLFYIVCFMLLSFSGIAQTFEIYKGDTINKTDAEGKKQGRWRITGNLKPSNT